MSEVVGHAVGLDKCGEIVIPREILDRHGWDIGTPLMTADADPGVIVTSTDEALAWLQSRWDDRDLVAELLEERRADVEREGVQVIGQEALFGWLCVKECHLGDGSSPHWKRK